MPKVSVIVPNYNHQSFLKQRIDSILNQTYQDFELILLDDASTDNSLEVLNGYKTHPKVSHLIVNLVNSGSPFVQWRRGIELATGDFIWIAESDDFAENTFLEKTVLSLENNPFWSLVYVDSRVVDAKNNHIDLWSIRKNNRFKTNRWSFDYTAIGKSEVIDFLLYSVTINNASAVLFRKKNLSSPIFLNELSSYKTAGDLFTYIVVVLQGKISYISQPLNNFREHELNVTKKNTRSGLIYLERINCFTHAILFLASTGLTKKESQNLKKPFKSFLKKNGFKLIDFGYYKELRDFIKRTTQSKIINRMEGRYCALLFKIITLKPKVFRKTARKLIKKVL